MENPIKMDDLGVPLFLETPIWFPLISLNFHTNCVVQHRIALTIVRTEPTWHAPLSYCTLERPNLHWGRRDMLEAFLQLHPKIPRATSWNYLKLPTLERKWLKLPCFETFPLPHFSYEISWVSMFSLQVFTPSTVGPDSTTRESFSNHPFVGSKTSFKRTKPSALSSKIFCQGDHFGIHNSLHLLGRFVWKGIT